MDPEADAAYIKIRRARLDDNVDIEEGVSVDLDEDRHIVGVEILDARKRLSPTDLQHHDREAAARSESRLAGAPVLRLTPARSEARPAPSSTRGDSRRGGSRRPCRRDRSADLANPRWRRTGCRPRGPPR